VGAAEVLLQVVLEVLVVQALGEVLPMVSVAQAIRQSLPLLKEITVEMLQLQLLVAEVAAAVQEV
jgi:hypothetical protein